MGRFHVYISAAFAVFLSACATSEKKQFTLENALGAKEAISIPIRITEKGLIVIDGVKVDGRPLEMIMDTGATRSAIFETALEGVGGNLQPHQDTIVHGMIQSEKHSVVNLPKVEIGPLKYDSMSMVLLDDRDDDFQKVEKYDGLIGMDILSEYQIYVSPAKNELRFIANKTPVSVSYFWPRIFLKENPFQLDNRDLHFMDIRINGRQTSSLLDTGAEFSAMNWTAANFVRTKPIRKKLREEWELQGAVGIFQPITKVEINQFRGGQIFWNNEEFVIMDLDSLEVLGIENKPFIIAGMNLFDGEAVFIDFERDFLSIVPEDQNGDISEAR